jgi:hypothetical protein
MLQRRIFMFYLTTVLTDATDLPPAQAGTSSLVPYALLVHCLSSPLAHFKPGTPVHGGGPCNTQDQYCSRQEHDSSGWREPARLSRGTQKCSRTQSGEIYRERRLELIGMEAGSSQLLTTTGTQPQKIPAPHITHTEVRHGVGKAHCASLRRSARPVGATVKLSRNRTACPNRLISTLQVTNHP